MGEGKKTWIHISSDVFLIRIHNTFQSPAIYLINNSNETHRVWCNCQTEKTAVIYATQMVWILMCECLRFEPNGIQIKRYICDKCVICSHLAIFMGVIIRKPKEKHVIFHSTCARW